MPELKSSRQITRLYLASNYYEPLNEMFRGFFMDERKQIERETIEKMRMHFVFNSLNGIHHMIDKNPEVAKEMVYDLSMVMRGYVDMITCERKIATEEELDYVESYIRLMNAGRDYLTLEIRGVVEGEMMAGEILVPLAAKIKEEVISQSLFYRVIVTLNDGPPAIEIVIGDR